MIKIFKNYYIIDGVIEDSSEFRRLHRSLTSFNFKTKENYMPIYLYFNGEMRVPNSVRLDYLLDLVDDKRVFVEEEKSLSPSALDFPVCHSEPREDLQADAIKHLLESTKTHRSVSISTGKGKTFITIYSLCKLKYKPLIIVDSNSIEEQWYNEWIRHTNISKEQICILTASDIRNNSYNRNAMVYIITHQSLSSLISTNYKEIQKFIDENGIRAKVFDEAHIQFQNMCEVNCVSDTDLVIYLSATLARNYKEKKKYELVFSEVDQYMNKEQPKYHKIMLYRINTHPNMYDKKYVHTSRGMSATNWGNYVLNRLKRNDFNYIFNTVAKIIRDLNIKDDDKSKIAIVLPLNAMIDSLEESMNKKDFDCVVFNSESKKKITLEEVFKHKYIITNEKIFNKAINNLSLNIVINFVPFSDRTLLEQLLGRLRYKEGRDSYYIDVCDEGFEGFVKQQKTRVTYYKKITTDLELLKDIKQISSF